MKEKKNKEEEKKNTNIPEHMVQPMREREKKWLLPRRKKNAHTSLANCHHC